jgi:hypothetical protein
MGAAVLESTFTHIPGIGLRTERRLWARGVITWADAFERDDLPLSPARLDQVRRILKDSRRALWASEPKFFLDRLAPAEHWRLISRFRDQAAYLDIETTGLGAWAEITTIALYDGHGARVFIQGEDLDDFPQAVSGCRLLITYGGKTFDLPVLERYFGLKLDMAHIDLRYVLAGAGVTGGLKGCERKLGVGRAGLEDIDGYGAVLLWHLYQATSDRRALETLLAYNLQDALNLEPLMIAAYNLRLAGLPCPGHAPLPAVESLRNPFGPDASVLAWLRGRLQDGHRSWVPADRRLGLSAGER